MKNQKGITMISLIIYIIALLIVIGVVATISRYFYKNVENSAEQVDPMSEYIKFNSFFSEEINSQGIQVLEAQENYIVFNNGVQYTYIPENKGIYRNKVKICRLVDDCNFIYSENGDTNTVQVIFKVKDFSNSVVYNLKK